MSKWKENWEDDYGDDDDYDAYDEEYEEQEETESIKKATASKPKATAAAAAAPQPKKEKAKKQVTPSKEEVIKVADPFENKKRQEELRRLADLENTKDLFGVVSDPSGKSDSIANESSGLFSSKPRDFDDEDAVSIDQVGGPSSSQTAASVPSSSDAFITFKPKTAAEFTQFAESISKQIFAATNGAQKTLFVEFIKELNKKLTDQVNTDDLQSIALSINANVNQRIQSAKVQKKKKPAAKVNMGGRNDSLDAFF